MTAVQKIIRSIERVEIILIAIILGMEVLSAGTVLTFKLLDFTRTALASADTKVANFLSDEIMQFTTVVQTAGLVWLGFLGGSLAVSRRENIAIDLINTIIPENKRGGMDFLIQYMSAAITLCFMLLGAKFFLDTLNNEVFEAAGQVHFSSALKAWSKIVYPIMLSVMAFKFILTAHNKPNSADLHANLH